ncbi:J domain-containing protein [Reyranella sp.]|uniref:J domain-containing protein n=1 Tax=Reyranella sp. TaxID=1929291 RepID=UPI0040355F95
MTDATRYPLSWPTGWKRSPVGGRRPATFRKHGKWLTVTQGFERLVSELDRLGAKDRLVSCNVERGARGAPLSGRPEPADRGVAAYFTLKGKPRVLACDTFTTVADNMAAIAAHIECIRGIDRYGVGTLDQAFAGYDALPPPGAVAKIPWRKVFGLDEAVTPNRGELDRLYRQMAQQFHPDLQGGSHEAMAMLNTARDEALKEIG